MIFSLLLRNFKAYRGWHYIPISQGEYFSALIGENGVGKSSVLEALDTFFNKPLSEWNYNHSISKSGFDRPPEICPLFLIEKSKITKSRNLYKYLDAISAAVWQFESADYNSSHKEICDNIQSHIERSLIARPELEKDYFLFPIGVKKASSNETEFSLAIFESNSALSDDILNISDMHSPNIEDAITEIQSYIREEFDYIHIPSEIDYQSYTKIESKTIQSLMGTNLDTIIKSIIDDSTIKNINSGLDTFLAQIQEKLEKYEYKKPAKRQTLFNLSHLTSKIIETYFESKVLNLNEDGETTPIYNCSSGEKRRAIIDLAEAFILHTDRTVLNKTVILAIDEPEVSLHTSACFEQFEKISNISNNKVQTLISTHWYGFFPSVEKGSAVIISGNKREKSSNLINLVRFREDIKEIVQSTKGEYPNNIELKSINDLVQSVVASITRSKAKWIICEGASDKFYISHFFKNLDRTFVLSVGGSKFVKKFYEYLQLALSDNRPLIKGKVYLLLDTDKNFESYPATYPDKQKVIIKRLQADPKENVIKLLRTSDNNFYPPTTIEDCLEPNTFIKTLEDIGDDKVKNLVMELKSRCNFNNVPIPTGLAFDLRQSEKDLVEEFFKRPGTKIRFAEKYCENDVDNFQPEWIKEIATFLST